MGNSSGEASGQRQTSRAGSTPADSQSSGTPPENCTSPGEVFTIANALAALFAANMTQDQLQTLINMLTLLVAGLATIVTQQQICEGIVVQPPEGG